MEFTISLDGKDVAQRIRRLSRELMDAEQSFITIGKNFVQYYGSIPFASRGSIYGSVWPDLMPAYEQLKAEEYPGRPILIRTGELSQNFNFTTDKNSVTVFNPTTTPDGKYNLLQAHQEGWGNLPERVVLALNQDRRKVATDILMNDITRKVNGF